MIDRRSWLSDVVAVAATAGGLWACAGVNGIREVGGAILAAQVLASFGGPLWGFVAIGLAIAGAVAAGWSGAPDLAVLSVLGGLAVHRRAVWASARDDRLSLAIALLFVLFAILVDSPAMARGAAVVAGAGPWLLRSPSLRTAPMVALSALVGFVLPSSPRRPDLGTAPALADLRPPGGPDDRAVLRLYSADLSPPRYVRAAVLDRFDGVAWTRTAPAPVWPLLDDPGPRPIVIERGASADGWLPALGVVRGVVPMTGPFTRTDAGIRVDGSKDAVRYALVADPPWDGPADESEGDPRYLDVPDSLRELGTEASALAGDTPAETIRRMVADLREHHAYLLNPPAMEPDRPLVKFLREDRPGHCEYFASALAILLRLDGVPTRLVTGYAGGDLEDGVLTFRADAAHAWVEARVDGRWIPVDPTPGAELDPAIAPPRAPVLPVRGAAPVAAIGALAFLGLLPWLWRLRTPRTVAALHASAEAHLRRAGWDLPRDLPPVATAEWVRARIGDEAEPLLTLAWLHYRVRYGGEAADPLLPAARAAWSAARRLRPP